jgi:hypothetical protein
MTCKELRLHFEGRLHVEVFGEEAEHLGECPECARFVEARRELGMGLSLLRESVPQPSESLDAAVLANYQQQMVGHRAGVRSATSYRALVFVWSGLAAVLLLAVALVFRHERKTDAFVPSPLPTQSQSSVKAGTEPVAAIRASSVPASHRAIRGKSARDERSNHSSAAVVNPAPPPTSPALPEFQSLMYCDELSCGGAMQLIRVELASSAAAIASGGGSPGGIVYADVLVGADGIARGIRIEE